MSQSDCRYGFSTQTDHSYSLHGFPVAENYEGRPVRTFLDFRHQNLPVQWVSKLSATILQSVSKVKVVSFLIGLTLMFIIMASYILTWDKKGLLFTPSPDQSRPMVILTNTAAAAGRGEDVSSDNLTDIKLLVNIISSKLEYTPRMVPDEKSIIETDPRVSLP